MSLNPYTGCSFKCLYCYATAYIGLRDSSPKKQFIARLARDLRRYDKRIPINIGTSSDPYPPEEAYYGLTRAALKLLVAENRKVLVTTKGTLYAKRDLDLMVKGRVAITPTITTLDPSISLYVEPGAPTPVSRLNALRTATRAGVPAGVRVDPIIPYLNDDPYMIEDLIGSIAEAGAVFVVTSTYKARPDSLKRLVSAFGGLGERIRKLYSEQGVKVNGYIYLRKSLREKLLGPVIDAARRAGMEYAVCREGLTGKLWFNAGSCDGTHLIPGPGDRRDEGLRRWLHS